MSSEKAACRFRFELPMGLPFYLWSCNAWYKILFHVSYSCSIPSPFVRFFPLPVNKKWLVLLMRMGVLVVFVMLHPFSCGPIDGRKITLYLVPPRWQATFLSHNSDHDGCQSFQHHLCTVQRDTLACSRHIHIPYHSSPQIAILG